MMPSVYWIFICAVVIRFGSGIKVRLADGSFRSHSITDLHHCPGPNSVDQPHLFASPDRLYDDHDRDVAQISHADDVAVVFHAMQGAGRSLLRSRLIRGRDDPDSIVDTAGFHTKIRFQDQINALHILNPGSYSGNVTEIETQVRRTRSVILDQELDLKRIFLIADLNALDDTYAGRLDRYLQQLSRAYDSNQFTIVLNKADTATAAEQAQREALLKRQEFISAQIPHIDLIRVSARDCTGPLVARLKDAIKSDGVGTQRDRQQVAALKTSTNLTASMLKSVKDTLQHTMNFPPRDLDSCPVVKTCNLGETQLRWTLDWLKAGAKRSTLMPHLHESDPDVVDTKSNYDLYASFWTKRQEHLERYVKRLELVERMDSKLNEFDSISRTLQDDVAFQIDQGRRTNRARLQFLEGFQQE